MAEKKTRTKADAVKAMRKALRKRLKEAGADGAAPAIPTLEVDQSLAAAAAPLDLDTMPGFTVTVSGSLPGILTGCVLRKGPIRAETAEAAIANFMSEVGTQFRKPGLFVVAKCDVKDAKVARQGTLALSEPKKVGDDDGGPG